MLDRHLTADDLDKTLRQDVMDGLSATPKALPPKWFYDERGSALFEQITQLDEYYLTRRERTILVRRSAEIASVSQAVTLLELGAGSGEKTRLLLRALQQAGTLREYVPVDVSGDYLAAAAGQIADEYPDVSVHAIVADYERHLHLLPRQGRRLIAFLGSTIGNLLPGERNTFLSQLAATMGAGDRLLLGADLVKDPARLVRAYDDAQGVTAEFNHNVLHVINRRLDADFAPASYEHVALWDDRNEWIEMRLRSPRDHLVRVRALNLTIPIAAGEEIRTEISAKFRLEGLAAELAAAGLTLDRSWTDPAGDFILCLARPA